MEKTENRNMNCARISKLRNQYSSSKPMGTNLYTHGKSIYYEVTCCVSRSINAHYYISDLFPARRSV